MGYVAALVIGAGNVAMTPFVLVKMWLWFVVPLGVPEIAYWHAFGIGLLISYTTHQLPGNPPKLEAEDHIANAIGRLLATFIVWGAGSLIHGQMA